MRKKTKQAVEYLINEIGNEYDEDGQVIIHTGLYRHSDGELYQQEENNG